MQPRYFFAGTEEGLGIPRAPYSLTVHYEESNKRTVFKWRNTFGGYDYIQGFLRWEGNVKQRMPIIFWRCRRVELLRLTSNRGCKDAEMFSEMDLWIFGYKDDVPSNAAGIRMKYSFQEEYDGIPFARKYRPQLDHFQTPKVMIIRVSPWAFVNNL